MYSLGSEKIDLVDILSQHYQPGTKLFNILVQHGNRVAEKALKAAERIRHLNPDLDFIQEGAMLHDIGIFLTNSPEIGCFGRSPYVCHGYLGRKLLDKAGLPNHGLVCERHVGLGITRKEIQERNLPLPLRDMVPVSTEERIICYADKFFSKNGSQGTREKTVDEVIYGIEKYAPDHIELFLEWVNLFGD